MKNYRRSLGLGNLVLLAGLFGSGTTAQAQHHGHGGHHGGYGYAHGHHPSYGYNFNQGYRGVVLPNYSYGFGYNSRPYGNNYGYSYNYNFGYNSGDYGYAPRRGHCR